MNRLQTNNQMKVIYYKEVDFPFRVRDISKQHFQSCPALKHASPSLRSNLTWKSYAVGNPQRRLVLKKLMTISLIRVRIKSAHQTADILATYRSFVQKYYPQIAKTISRNDVIALYFVKSRYAFSNSSLKMNQ